MARIKSISSELQYLDKVQDRCVELCKYLEKYHDSRYDDLYLKLLNVVGTLEDVLEFDI